MGDGPRTPGWPMTTSTYASRWSDGDVPPDGKVTATLNNPGNQADLEYQRHCAGRRSMGPRSTYDGARSIRHLPRPDRHVAPAAQTSTRRWYRTTTETADYPESGHQIASESDVGFFFCCPGGGGLVAGQTWGPVRRKRRGRQ